MHGSELAAERRELLLSVEDVGLDFDEHRVGLVEDVDFLVLSSRDDVLPGDLDAVDCLLAVEVGLGRLLNDSPPDLQSALVGCDRIGGGGGGV